MLPKQHITVDFLRLYNNEATLGNEHDQIYCGVEAGSRQTKDSYTPYFSRKSGRGHLYILCVSSASSYFELCKTALFAA